MGWGAGWGTVAERTYTDFGNRVDAVAEHCVYIDDIKLVQTSLSNLQKYSGGKEISYTVVEHEDGTLGDHFHVKNITKTGNEVVVENVFNMSTEAFTVRKEWENEGDRGINRPTVYVQLYEKVGTDWVVVETTEGTHMAGRVELNVGNSWAHTWDVPSNGTQYMVQEVDANGAPVTELPVEGGKYIVSYDTNNGQFSDDTRLVLITKIYGTERRKSVERHL